MKDSNLKKGFKAFRNTIKDDNRKLRQIRDCNSCKYLYKDDESESEEICYNNSVTSYDMVDEGNIKYCTFWTPIWHKE